MVMKIYNLTFKEGKDVTLQKIKEYEPLSSVVERMLEEVNVDILAEQDSDLNVSTDSNITDNEHDIDDINSYILYDPDRPQHQKDFDIGPYINER